MNYASNHYKHKLTRLIIQCTTNHVPCLSDCVHLANELNIIKNLSLQSKSIMHIMIIQYWCITSRFTVCDFYARVEWIRPAMIYLDACDSSTQDLFPDTISTDHAHPTPFRLSLIDNGRFQYKIRAWRGLDPAVLRMAFPYA